MSIESMLECFFYQSDVIFFCFSVLVGGNTSFVNEAGCQTFGFKRAVIFIPTVTSVLSIFRLVLDYLLLWLLMMLDMLSMQL